MRYDPVKILAARDDDDKRHRRVFSWYFGSVRTPAFAVSFSISFSSSSSSPFRFGRWGEHADLRWSPEAVTVFAGCVRPRDTSSFWGQTRTEEKQMRWRRTSLYRMRHARKVPASIHRNGAVSPRYSTTNPRRRRTQATNNYVASVREWKARAGRPLRARVQVVQDEAGTQNYETEARFRLPRRIYEKLRKRENACLISRGISWRISSLWLGCSR